MNYINILPGVITALIGLMTAFFAIKNELKKNTENMLQSKLNDEKRISFQEQRMALTEEKMHFVEEILKERLEEINSRISELSNYFISHLKEGHI